MDKIVSLTNGHPYLIQLLCEQLVLLLNQIRLGNEATHTPADKTRKIDPALIDQAIPIAMERGDQFFREFWSLSLTQSDRTFITALLQQQPLPTGKTGDRLIEKNILCKGETGDNNSYQFQVPFLELHCRKMIDV